MTSHAGNTHFLFGDVTGNANAIGLFVDNALPQIGYSDAIVVAAPPALTIPLGRAIEASRNGDKAGVEGSLRTVLEVQYGLLSKTLGDANAADETRKLVADVQNIMEQLVRVLDPATLQFVRAMPEIWTARLVASRLQLADVTSEVVLPSSLVRTRMGSYLSVISSTANLQQAITAAPGTVVMPAIATDELGHVAVCPANHFVGFVSRAMGSRSITTWTQSGKVDSSDQAEVASVSIDSLSTGEVAELSRLLHPMLPCAENTSSSTEVRIRSVSGGSATEVSDQAKPNGVKVVHVTEAIRVLHVDCTCCEISSVVEQVEKALAKTQVKPFATDIDKEARRYSLVFNSDVAIYIKELLRVNGIKSVTIEDGKAMVAIVGDGLDTDWLLNFQFQQILGSAMDMTAKTDVSSIAIVNDPQLAIEKVPAIHADLVAQETPATGASWRR